MPVKRAQYTIRGVLPEVDIALRGMARDRHLSFNALVQALERIAEQSKETTLNHDLDFVVGSMTDGKLIDEALQEFNRIDEEVWK